MSEFENETTELSLKEQRGIFLTVLCVLSWISTGIAIISNLATLTQGKNGVQQQILDLEAQLENTEDELAYSLIETSINTLHITLENFMAINITTLILALLGAYGVYLMFNLKKTGFYLYVAYAILSPFASYYFFKDTQFIVATLVLSLVISLVFIILYGINLKRMTVE
jgi:hypothetical protein